MHNGLKMIGGSLLAAWLALNPAHALGEEKNGEPVSIPQPSAPNREAWMEASDYSVQNEVVAFSINGYAKDATNKQIAEFLKAQFAARGVPAVYFRGHEDRLGASAAFFIHGHQYGPFGVRDMPKAVENVSNQAKGVLSGLNTDIQKNIPG